MGAQFDLLTSQTLRNKLYHIILHIGSLVELFKILIHLTRAWMHRIRSCMSFPHYGFLMSLSVGTQRRFRNPNTPCTLKILMPCNYVPHPGFKVEKVLPLAPFWIDSNNEDWISRMLNLPCILGSQISIPFWSSLAARLSVSSTERKSTPKQIFYSKH